MFANKYKLQHLYDDTFRIAHSDKIKLFQEAEGCLSEEDEGDNNQETVTEPQVRRSNRLQHKSRINYDEQDNK